MLLNEKRMTCKNNVFSMWRGCNGAKSNLLHRGGIRCSERLPWLRNSSARWRSGTNTGAVTSTCWLNTTTCTVVQNIWLSSGDSYTYPHGDRNQPPALHGWYQLAGNEAEKHWRMCREKIHTQISACHTLVLLCLWINICFRGQTLTLMSLNQTEVFTL